MSEYHQVEINLDCKDSLVETLKEMGYKPIVVDKSINLKGFQGDQRPEKAHIVIPRSQVGQASNDIGFEKVGDKYIMHFSEFDQSTKKFDIAKMKKLYGACKLKRFIGKSSKYKFLKQEETKDGKIKIRLRKRS